MAASRGSPTSSNVTHRSSHSDASRAGVHATTSTGAETTRRSYDSILVLLRSTGRTNADQLLNPSGPRWDLVFQIWRDGSASLAMQFPPTYTARPWQELEDRMAQVGFESFDSIRYKEAGTLRHFEHKDWFTVMLWVVDVTCHKCDWIEKDIKERTIWKCQLQAALPFSEVSKNYNRAPRAPRDARRERNIRSRASSPYGVQSESGQSNATSRDETFPAPRSNTKANGRETEQWQYGESASPRSRMKSGQSDATTRDDTFSVPRNNTKVNAWDTEPGQSEDSASLRSRIESGEIPQPEVDCFGWPIMDGQAAKAVGPSPWD